MEERFTEKDAKECFKRLAEFMGKEHTDCWEKVNEKWISKIGCWTLSYNPTYGGAVIQEIADVDGSVTRPLGEKRLSPREFCNATEMIIRAIDIDRKRREKEMD